MQKAPPGKPVVANTTRVIGLRDKACIRFASTDLANGMALHTQAQLSDSLSRKASEICKESIRSAMHG
jgi:hypothetical protein